MLLSTLNMLNYLSLGNLEDARVEARRLDITEHTLADENKENDKALLGIGDYLSGFTFEMSGRYEQALQKYAEASQNNNYLSLNKLIPQLASCTSYRDELIDSIIAANPQSVEDGANPGCSAGSDKTGSLLVVTSSGLAPYKRANRLPIGAAVVLAGAFLTPVQLNQANDFAVKGLLKWVNFPELVQSSPQFTKVSVSVDGTPVNIELGENVSLLVKSYWEQIKGKLIAAAIVRMIARAVAGAGTNQAIKSASGDSGLGLLAQVLVEGAMTVADTPDTRTWNTLPAAFFISRVELPPGEHNIKIDFFGNGKTISVNKRIKITSGGFTVIPVHTMR
jgi:hypothetical protein